MAPFDIKIENNYGSIFGVTNNFFGQASPSDARWSSEAETVDFEEVNDDKPVTATETDQATSSDDTVLSEKDIQAMREMALKAYLMRLEVLAEDSFKNRFNTLIDNILCEDVIKRWLLNASSNQFKDYNKTRVFRLAGMLKLQHVLKYKSDLELNPVLENITKDTSHRKSMSHKDEDASVISKLLASIVCKIPQ